MSEALSLMDLYSLLRQRCAEAGSQKAFAEMHGLSPTYVSDVLNARTEPGPGVLAALGLRRAVRYVKVRTDG